MSKYRKHEGTKTRKGAKGVRFRGLRDFVFRRFLCGLCVLAVQIAILTVTNTQEGHYQALREAGRIAKTVFLLNFLTVEAVRRCIQVGLNRQDRPATLCNTLLKTTSISCPMQAAALDRVLVGSASRRAPRHPDKSLGAFL